MIAELEKFQLKRSAPLKSSNDGNSARASGGAITDNKPPFDLPVIRLFSGLRVIGDLAKMETPRAESNKSLSRFEICEYPNDLLLTHDNLHESSRVTGGVEHISPQWEPTTRRIRAITACNDAPDQCQIPLRLLTSPATERRHRRPGLLSEALRDQIGGCSGASLVRFGPPHLCAVTGQGGLRFDRISRR